MLGASATRVGTSCCNVEGGEGRQVWSRQGWRGQGRKRGGAGQRTAAGWRAAHLSVSTLQSIPARAGMAAQQVLQEGQAASLAGVPLACALDPAHGRRAADKSS
jgi:hypothetical protein